MHGLWGHLGRGSRTLAAILDGADRHPALLRAHDALHHLLFHLDRQDPFMLSRDFKGIKPLCLQAYHRFIEGCFQFHRYVNPFFALCSRDVV